MYKNFCPFKRLKKQWTFYLFSELQAFVLFQMCCSKNTEFWTVPSLPYCFFCLITIWVIALFQILVLVIHEHLACVPAPSHCTWVQVMTVPWCAVSSEFVEGLSISFSTFSFTLTVCELCPTVQLKNLISTLSWQKFMCMLFHCRLKSILKLNEITGDASCNIKTFFGFPSQLKIVDRQIITVADVTCDISAISGLLNGIIHHRESIMTGKWCKSKQPLWCQSIFSYFVPGKGYCGNEWVTSVLSLPCPVIKACCVTSNQVSSPGYLPRSYTSCFLAILWYVSWDRPIHSDCSSSRIRDQRIFFV